MDLFFVGMAAGIALHRLIMAIVLAETPDSKCAYCKWAKKGRRHIDDDTEELF